MSEYKMPSIKKEIEKLEGENPVVRLSILEEELMEVDEQGTLNAWPIAERMREARLKKAIAALKEEISRKKSQQEKLPEEELPYEKAA